MSEIFPPLTDYNDLASVEGFDAVREQIEQAVPAVAPAQRERVFPPLPDPDDAPTNEPPPPPSDWPMPTITGAAPTDLQADVLPGWLGEFTGAVCDSLQVPATMCVGMALSVLAACVQRRYVVEVHDGYQEPTSLDTLTFACSGSRKSATFKAFCAPLDPWEHRSCERMRREIAANNARISVAEATIKRLQAQAGKADDPQERESLRKLIEGEMADMPERMFAPRAYVSEATVERLQMLLVEQGGRIAVLSDESGLLSTLNSNYGGAGGPSWDVVLVGHAAGDLHVERASRNAHMTRVAVSLGLMVQPDLVNELAGSNKFRASGLAARFLYFVPRPFVGGRDVRRFTSIPPDVRDRYVRCIDEMLPNPMDGPYLAPRVVPLTAQALELWFDFAQECETGLAEGGALASISDLGAKLAGTAARIALLFELVVAGPAPDAVGEDSMARAIALCQQLVPHARAAYRLLAADESDRDADHVLQWIVGKGERESVKQADIHFALRARFTKRERLVAALQRLQSNGCLRHTVVKNQGARPSDVWRINPRLFHESMFL